MWYFLYNFLLILAAPVILLILLAKQRCRRGLPQRMGWGAGEATAGPVKGRILWVHAVSLGEVVAAVPLIRELHAREPDYRILVTTVTETGREAVEQRLSGLADHAYAPLDFPWVVSKVIDRLNPALFLFVETELWPNLIRALWRRRVPSILVNGRISSGSFRGYRMLRPLWARVLGMVAYCLMQSDRDASRILALGAPQTRVLRTGNIKFDQPEPDDIESPEGLARPTMLDKHEELIVAGSTHPGEEEGILSCYAALLKEFPALVLLLAPRHIDRVDQVEAAVKAQGLPAVRRSRLEGQARSKGPRVIILDTRGELAAVYRHGVLSFVGGTLVPVGGHNLLEPAMWSKPVLFGPHTDHCSEVATLLLEAGGGCRIETHADLAAQTTRLLRDRSALQRMGLAARQVLLDNRGAVKRSVDVIDDVLHGRAGTRCDAALAGVEKAAQKACEERGITGDA